jgi:CRP/FNR family transcriptional regulator, cyclic AMP receptor protein
MNASEVLLPIIKAYPKRHFKRGMLLIQEGDVSGPLYVLLAGRLKAFSYSDEGKEITYGVYSPVDLIGEMSLDGGPRSASVVAEEACECVVLSLSDLQTQLQRNPSFSFWLVQRVIQRARSATLDARGMALLDVYGRLRTFLEREVFADDFNVSIDRRFTHQEIAHRIGSSREMVSKLIKGLESGGFIDIVDRQIRMKKLLPPKW